MVHKYSKHVHTSTEAKEGRRFFISHGPQKPYGLLGTGGRAQAVWDLYGGDFGTQMRGDKERPFRGVTIYGRVWRKAVEKPRDFDCDEINRVYFELEGKIDSEQRSVSIGGRVPEGKRCLKCAHNCYFLFFCSFTFSCSFCWWSVFNLLWAPFCYSLCECVLHFKSLMKLNYAPWIWRK